MTDKLADGYAYIRDLLVVERDQALYAARQSAREAAPSVRRATVRRNVERALDLADAIDWFDAHHGESAVPAFTSTNFLCARLWWTTPTQDHIHQCEKPAGHGSAHRCRCGETTATADQPVPSEGPHGA